MPYIVRDPQSRDSADSSEVNFNYDYPGGLNIKPGSKLHKKIKDEVLKRATESSGVMSKRFESWNQIDKTLTTYIELDDQEKTLKTHDERKPVSIVFPYSYAILETVLSYLMAAFLQKPVFLYDYVSPEDAVGTIMLEKVIDVHCSSRWTKVPLALHTMFRDCLTYGMGIVYPEWMRKFGTRTVAAETGFFSGIKNMFVQEGYERRVEEVVKFEGNRLKNLDSYLILPDPNVSVSEVQDGEYFGWLERSNYMSLLSEEKNDDSLFNVKYVKSVHNKQTSIYANDKSARGKYATGGTNQYTLSGKSGEQTLRTSTVTYPVDIINMYITLIPKEWGLSKEEYPEKWLFSLAADDVVIRAQPLDLDHGLYPVAVCAPDFDGYSSTPISRLETLYGLQGTLDWMFNMHVANVRKAINDMFVYDPYLVNTKDLEKPGPGKLIRMRRPGWGRGVKDAVMQLGVNDITRQHIGDAGFIVEFMQKIGAADETMMGALRRGGPERLTGKEFQGTQQGAFSRLERIARMISIQAMGDIGYMFAAHTQQMMDEELYVTTTGRWQQRLMEDFGVRDDRMKVTPFDLLVDYDIEVRDGSVPGGTATDSWIQVFKILMESEVVGQNFDILRVFKHIARQLGAKNVDDFIKVKTAPDDQMEEQARQGNVVPMEEAIGAGIV